MRSMLDDILANVLNSDGSEFTIYYHVKAWYSSSHFSWSFIEMASQRSGDERSDYLDTTMSLADPTRVTIIAKGDRMKIPRVLCSVCILPQSSSSEEESGVNLAPTALSSQRVRQVVERFNIWPYPQPSHDTVAQVTAQDYGFLTHSLKYCYIESIHVHAH